MFYPVPSLCDPRVGHYEELVNTNAGRVEIEPDRSLEFVSVKKVGGAAGTRTLYLFNAIEALSQMSYSPGLIQ